MDYESALELFKRVRQLAARLKVIEQEVEELTAAIDGLTAVDYARIRVQTCNSSDLADVVERLCAVRSKLYKTWDELIDERARARRIIERVGESGDYTSAALLHSRYINAATWRQTAASLGFSREYTEKFLHKKALAAVSNILNMS